MTRITSFNLPKKSFVSSAAEESHAEAGPSSKALKSTEQPKKSKRRGRRGKTEAELAASDAKATPYAQRGYRQSERPKDGGGWKRDPTIAKRAKYAAERAEERRLGRQKQAQASTTCFACRSVGHSARECPNVLLAVDGPPGTAEMLGDTSIKDKAEGQLASHDVDVEEKPKKGMKRKKGKLGADLVGNKCYRCDSMAHSLHHCPEPIDLDNPTPFAKCYICLGRGHLASLCPNNAGKGIYVNGGSCKVCGSTAHRAKDCPELPQRETGRIEDRRGVQRVREDLVGVQGGADEDDWMVQSRSAIRGDEGGDGPAKKIKKAAAGRMGGLGQPGNGDIKPDHAPVIDQPAKATGAQARPGSSVTAPFGTTSRPSGKPKKVIKF